jgi:hypothetical protein
MPTLNSDELSPNNASTRTVQTSVRLSPKYHILFIYLFIYLLGSNNSTSWACDNVWDLSYSQAKTWLEWERAGENRKVWFGFTNSNSFFELSDPKFLFSFSSETQESHFALAQRAGIIHAANIKDLQAKIHYIFNIRPGSHRLGRRASSNDEYPLIWYFFLFILFFVVCENIFYVK